MSNENIDLSIYPRDVWGSPFWRNILMDYPNKLVAIGDPVMDGPNVLGGTLLGVYDTGDDLLKDLPKFKQEWKKVIWRGTGPDPSLLML